MLVNYVPYYLTYLTVADASQENGNCIFQLCGFYAAGGGDLGPNNSQQALMEEQYGRC
jgi:hypothetical protein